MKPKYTFGINDYLVLKNNMSNFQTKAKKPHSDKWEKVSMLDNYFGRQYGVMFPDKTVYREEDCEIITN